MYHQESIENDYEYQYYQQDGDSLADTRVVIDLEFERQQQSYKMNDAVKSFITHFYRSIQNGKIFEITHDYEYGWNMLSEQYFKTTTWPSVESIESMIPNESMKSIFLILYKEMYFRHIYASLQGGPTLEHRFESYRNYVQLFNAILSAERPLDLELPIQWLWDIIDEFIYQFQSFCQYRAKQVKKGPNAPSNIVEEVQMLKQNSDVWNVHSVLNVLHSLVSKSNINKQLEVLKHATLSLTITNSNGNIDQTQFTKHQQELLQDLENDLFAQSSLYKMLGYFSLVGLLRLNSLFGDYYLAVNTMQFVELDIHKQSLIARVPSCIITTCYYVGFAYLMMRRYEDAIKVFVDALIYIQRTRTMFQAPARSLLNDMITKQNEQIFYLLAIALNFYPMRIDDSINSYLKEKYSERLIKLQRGDRDELTNMFHYACPKFLSPVPPNFEGVTDQYLMEPYNQQLKVFMDEVNQQLSISDIRSFLKLYTTLSISKLASFINKTPDELKAILLCFKHKMSNIESDQISEEFRSSSEVDFYINNDMVHIADTKVATRFSDFFIRQIQKTNEVN
ncbi:eukaryotic translation initiation factor 3 subunit L [Brachionus plicatilis]|uniref:Eukaryotic translation initiation factor 3 subunit L n=2 Tax=Brachionus plicatilis TaxID=10195 RepID=A0A3M7RQQ5_BRAPC|nr:eukaryotic translation initiation factor 3 subunit L [Brachionus plicatilis]